MEKVKRLNSSVTGSLATLSNDNVSTTTSPLVTYIQLQNFK